MMRRVQTDTNYYRNIAGKKFYKCPVGKENGGCDFFLWAPESDGAQTDSPQSSWGVTSQPSHSNTGWNVTSQQPPTSTRGWGLTPTFSRDSFERNDDDVNCNCGMPCKKLVLLSQGSI